MKFPGGGEIIDATKDPDFNFFYTQDMDPKHREIFSQVFNLVIQIVMSDQTCGDRKVFFV